MNKYDNYRLYTGILLLAIILSMNIYRAAMYYHLNTMKLTPFFISQTNIKEPLLNN
ncbi:UNVERIFIED_ORG: hypothetical protein DFS12_11069 [Chitinophaga ginsengisegetis]|nr:hypothetical protein [Chitinophaga ginsengisegetis]MDR6650463.1 hypothetical protein [Chitinophaga ginsengisegetis]MDR6656898.1 hypothetical protein [Chitinophaga ginsengisegetis]